MSADPYVELGVTRDATDAAIRAAYEEAITRAARDGYLENAKRIDAAFEVLRDPIRRQTFDRLGIIHDVHRPDPTQGFYANAAVPWRAWSPDGLVAAAPAQQRSRHPVVWLAVAAMIFAFIAVRMQTAQSGVTSSLTGDLAGTMSNSASPPVSKLAHPHRLLPAVAGPAGAGGYTFEAAARWDPCQPIRYVISGGEPFAGANAMLTQALNEAGAASGLRFVSAGTTTETASPDRPAYQPARYGRQWAPVLIAWTDQAAVPKLAGNVIGLGGAVSARVHGTTRLVTGLLYFDAPELFLIAQRGTGYAAMRTVMLHEIGHLLGLGHVQDPGAVMFPSDGAQGGYSAGDLRGLAYAGAGPCSHYS